MEKKTAKVPKLRFPGFTGEWKQQKLGELAQSFEYGLNASATEFDGKNKYIRITDIDDETHEFKNDSLTSPNIDFLREDNYRLQEGDVLFARTGASVGKTYRYKTSDGLIYFAGFLIRARIKFGYDSEFVFQNTLTDSYNRFITITSQRSGQPGVNAQEYADFTLSVPKFEEQQRIGSFFKKLDNIIALYQRKLTHLQAKKKVLLQKIFPKQGECFPELRFPGFSDAWEQHKLNDITMKIGSGKTPRGGAGSYVCVGIPLIRSQNVVNDSVDLADVVFITDEVDTEMKNSRVITNDVLLNITGASIGRSAVYRGVEHANVNQHVCIIRPERLFFSDFIQLQLASTNGQIQIDTNQAGGAREGLNFQQIGKMEFSFPGIDEQQKISAFFVRQNNLCTLYQRKLAHLQEQKKALLQQMFV